MGYNTSVVILNDAIHNLPNDKEFGEKLYKAILKVGSSNRSEDVSIGNHCNSCQVVASRHADDLSVIVVGGNCGEEIGRAYGRNADKIEILKQLCDQNGYRMVKKAKKVN